MLILAKNIPADFFGGDEISIHIDEEQAIASGSVDQEVTILGYYRFFCVIVKDHGNTAVFCVFDDCADIVSLLDIDRKVSVRILLADIKDHTICDACGLYRF